MNARSDILQGAEKLVNGDRNVQYGEANQDFTRTAALWSAYKDVEFSAHDVAIMMTLLKISRLAWNKDKRDSWEDGIGYLACGWSCVAPEDAGEIVPTVTIYGNPLDEQWSSSGVVSSRISDGCSYMILGHDGYSETEKQCLIS